MLESLPVPRPNLDSILAARRAALGLLLAEAPVVAAEAGVEFPTRLCQAVLAYLDSQGLAVTAGDFDQR
ncbi:MAG: hypothetical protein ACYCS7_16865 [Acidimicrobiales bacterium]